MSILRNAFVFCMIVFCAGVACGQDFPSKPIRIVTGAGGGNEFKGRIIAQLITGPLGQPVLMDFRPTPIIVNDTIAKAAPDGYTMLIGGGTLWVQPFFQKVPYEVPRDFAPITLVDKSPTTLAVHPSLPVKSVKELIALARAQPGKIDYASGTPGNTAWIAMELFQSMAGIRMLNVPYKTVGQGLTALIGGEVQLQFTEMVLVAPHVKAGRLKVLAVSSAQPSALAPGLPTIAASGVPGYEFVSVTAMLAPGKTPEPIIRRLNQEIVRALNNPELRQKFADAGIDTGSSSPEELAAFMKSDMSKVGKLLKDINFVRTD